MSKASDQLKGQIATPGRWVLADDPPQPALPICRPIGAEIGPVLIEQVLRLYYLHRGRIRTREKPFAGKIQWN